MTSLYFPLASLFICFLLYVVFNNKERVNNKETKIFSKMINVNLIETFLAIFIILIAKNLGTVFYLKYLNRLDFILLALWVYYLCIYIYGFSNSTISNKISKFLKILILISAVALVILPFEIINNGETIDTSGLAPDFVSLIVGFFGLAMIFELVKNIFYNKKDFKLGKYSPLFAFIGLLILTLIFREICPTLTLEPFMISYVDLIMFFTIENPDLKMIKEISDSRDKAEKYSNDKAVFLFNMSQQIRGPLKNIENLSNNIMVDDNIDSIKNQVNDIKINSQRLQYIINDSMDISTLDSKNIKISDGDYDLKNIVKQCTLKVKEELKGKNISFNSYVSESIPNKLSGDQIRIKQIINSLLNYSLKNTSSGFIDLNINSILKYDVCRIIIKIDDSGSPMNQSELEKSSNDIDDKYEDNAILTFENLKKLVNLIGGTIIIENSNGKGNSITVMLDQKILDNNNETDKVIEKYQSEKDNMTKILFIQKDKYKFMNNKYFDSNKYAVTSMDTGEKALNCLRNKEEFDLIFIDNDIDKLDIFTIFDRMKQIQFFNTPVCAVIEAQNQKEKLKYYNYGFNYVLLKPIKLKDLDSIMEKVDNSKIE